MQPLSGEVIKPLKKVRFLFIFYFYLKYKVANEKILTINSGQ